MIQKHCFECGTALIEKELEEEGIVPYCPKCQQYRFPMYNVAVSMIVVDTTTPILTGMDALHGYSTSGILFSRAILRHCSRRFPDTSLKTRTHITKPTNAWREML